MKNRKWKQSKWEWYGRASTTVRSRAVWPTGRSLWAVGWPTCNILVVPYAVHVSPAQPINLVWAMSDSLSSGKPFPITMTLPPKSQSYSTSFSTINNIRKQIRYYIHSWYCIITCFFFFFNFNTIYSSEHTRMQEAKTLIFKIYMKNIYINEWISNL